MKRMGRRVSNDHMIFVSFFHSFWMSILFDGNFWSRIAYVQSVQTAEYARNTFAS